MLMTQKKLNKDPPIVLLRNLNTHANCDHMKSWKMAALWSTAWSK